MRLTSGRRLIWVSIFFMLLITTLAGRLYELQVTRADQYSLAAYKQRTLRLPTTSRRGMILDRNGVKLTDPQPSWGLALFPPLISDPLGVSRSLSALIDVPESRVLEWFSASDNERNASWLPIEVTEGVADRLRTLRLPGVVSAPIGIRYGPGSLARHLVGHVNEQGGSGGLEQAFEQALAGEAVPSLVLYLDGNDSPLNGLGVRSVLPRTGKEPFHLQTTLDVRAQRAVERVLDSRQRPDGGPLRAAVVVMDPKTGEVLALASRPNYDQTADPGVRPDLGEAFQLNRAVSGFEPGSVFKAIIAAAALEGGHTHLDEEFQCDGHYDLAGQRFTDFGGTAHGRITFAEALAKSCNIVFAKIGYERLGARQILQAAERFGFGRGTGIGVDEGSGTLPAMEYGGDVAQAAFGQGLLVTPLQIARAFSAIANNGLLPSPRLIKVVKSPSGRVMERPVQPKSVRILSPQTVQALQGALRGVTDPQGVGTGKKAWVDGVGSAGKTGSAEGTENGSPTTHAWFAGYLPAESPRYVVVVMVQGGMLGGDVAAPIFREIGEALMQVERPAS